MSARLVLYLGAAELEFTRPGTDAPYPWLTRVGSLRIAARAGTPTGLGATETPSLVVSLDNQAGQASAIVQTPLRARATVFNADGSVYFDGTIATVSPARSLSLTIQA